jgi:transposase InsO family protein
VKFEWIHQHRDQSSDWTIDALCNTLDVSRSGYYAWIGRAPSPQAQRRVELLDAIRADYELGRCNYGSPRIHKALAERGIDVCVNTVAKLMRQADLHAKCCKRFRACRTTDSRHDYRPADNLVDQDFTADAPDQKWLCDITYVQTEQGTIYLASVLDVYSRKIVGWQIADHLRAELCVEALSMAIRARRMPGGGGGGGPSLIHHSDRGVQYACDAYQQLLKEHQIVCSMSRRGNCYDNAMMESFHSTYKRELVYQQPGGRFATQQEARRMTFEYIEVFYNRQRRHSAIGYVSPDAFEASRN